MCEIIIFHLLRSELNVCVLKNCNLSMSRICGIQWFSNEDDLS